MTWHFVDWHVEEDSHNIRPIARELRSKTVSAVYMPKFESRQAAQDYLNSPRVQWRLRLLDKFEAFAGHPISGTVIEIGAGPGMGAAYLSTKPTVERVYALDYETFSVEELMPKVFEAMHANPDKIVRALGSFNNMKVEDASVDFITAFGAIHHSENLSATLAECFRVLKPGGYLIASEPCEKNDLTKAAEYKKANKTVSVEQARNKFGEPIENVRYIDESNQVLRLCQYEAQAYDVGFDVYPILFDDTPENHGGWLMLQWRRLNARLKGDALLREPTYRGFIKMVLYPYFAPIHKNRMTPVYDPLWLILRKPSMDDKE